MGSHDNKKHKNNKKLCWVFCFHIQKQLKDLLITRLPSPITHHQVVTLSDFYIRTSSSHNQIKCRIKQNILTLMVAYSGSYVSSHRSCS